MQSSHSRAVRIREPSMFERGHRVFEGSDRRIAVAAVNKIAYFTLDNAVDIFYLFVNERRCRVYGRGRRNARRRVSPFTGMNKLCRYRKLGHISPDNRQKKKLSC